MYEELTDTQRKSMSRYEEIVAAHSAEVERINDETAARRAEQEERESREAEEAAARKAAAVEEAARMEKSLAEFEKNHQDASQASNNVSFGFDDDDGTDVAAEPQPPHRQSHGRRTRVEDVEDPLDDDFSERDFFR